MSIDKSINQMLRTAAPGQAFGREEIGLLQRYLAKYGFLMPAADGRTILDHAGAALEHTLTTEFGSFDSNTRDALRKAQKFYGLPVTGELDETTTELLKLPRYDHHPDIPQFVIAAKWGHTNLTFKFVNDTAKLTGTDAREAIRMAFRTWERVSKLRFQEVSSEQPADCEVLWARGDHQDGNPFDGPFGVLAHAFFPPPRGGSFPGDLHMDEDESWSVNPVDLLDAAKIDVVTVAAHEIGHALGLDHSQDHDALMFPFYGGPRRDSASPDLVRLGSDDIQGINTLYP